MKTYLPLPAGAHVSVTKHAACLDARVAPGSWNSWVPGGWSNVASLPVDYEMRGVLLAEIRVGEPIYLFRTERNGVTAEGFFSSSPVRQIQGDGRVITLNSVYAVVLEPEPRPASMTVDQLCSERRRT
ncbi:MAG: hypothetical protein WCH98_06800 [Verrucomicrobiota bacterium]